MYDEELKGSSRNQLRALTGNGPKHRRGTEPLFFAQVYCTCRLLYNNRYGTTVASY